MKVAKLVYVGFITRVIVDENATEEQIVEAAKPFFISNMEADWESSIEKIEDDTECLVLGVDKNGKPIDTGDEVNSPDPNGTDVFLNEFTGTVIGKRNGYIQVQDGDQEVFEIEPERLEVVIN